MNKSDLVDLIIAELKEICDESNIDTSDIDNQTVLFGGDSIIDSMALVGLIVKVEEYVLENTGKEIDVIDEETIIIDSKTPLENAVTLAELVLKKSNEA
jgi:acyl carrier protein